MMRYVLAAFMAVSIADMSHAQIQSVGDTLNEYKREKIRENQDKRLSAPISFAPRINEKEIERLPGSLKSVYIDSIKFQIDARCADVIDEASLMEMVKDIPGAALNIEEMRNVAGDIQEKCKDNNVTAYVPKQEFYDGILYINVVPEIK